MIKAIARLLPATLILVLLLGGIDADSVWISTASGSECGSRHEPDPGAALAAACATAPSTQTEIRPSRESLMAGKTYQGRQGRTIPYRLFVPGKYDRQQRYPLVLYLHGGGGLGSDNLKQIQGGNGFILDLFISPQTQARYPCLVVAPQSDDEGWVEDNSITPSDQLRLVLGLIEHLQQTYSLDRARLYIAGQSLGGFGTFAIMALRPDLFAAAVAICGGGDESKVRAMARVPVWAFHGDQDESVSVEESRSMIAALRRAGGRPKYTEYKGEGHIVWPKVVSEPELLPWLFNQRRPQ